MASIVFNKFLVPEDRGRVLSSITVTSSGETSTVVDQPHFWHWDVYLVLEPSALVKSRSVQLSIIPTNPPVGTLMITSREALGSEEFAKVELSIQVVGTPRVEQVIDLLVEKGMHRYHFDDTGAGCLFWIFVSLQQLADAGFVESSAVVKLREFHREQLSFHPERYPMPLKKGSFYWSVGPAPQLLFC